MEGEVGRAQPSACVDPHDQEGDASIPDQAVDKLCLSTGSIIAHNSRNALTDDPSRQQIPRDQFENSRLVGGVGALLCLPYTDSCLWWGMRPNRSKQEKQHATCTYQTRITWLNAHIPTMQQPKKEAGKTNHTHTHTHTHTTPHLSVLQRPDLQRPLLLVVRVVGGQRPFQRRRCSWGIPSGRPDRFELVPRRQRVFHVSVAGNKASSVGGRGDLRWQSSGRYHVARQPQPSHLG